MDSVPFTPLQRTRIVFFLILFAAALWAVFLIRQGQFFQFSLMFALIAGLNPVFVFLDVKSSQKMRGWIFFYLMVLVALLWATFLMIQGVMLWISVMLFIVVSGMCLFSLVMEEPDLTAASVAS
ncbi:MAG: hypothetical protein Q7T80_06020 [Methanoregula sp.]|nr:hypothetical protein [Methanoregula sp.]